jgi:hypothetical protein
MITQGLEKLILCGRAFPKTFVAGGGQKSNIFIENDRFIVITDIVYFSRTNLRGENSYLESIDNRDPLQLNSLTTQLTILSERGFNRFLFRDNLISHPNNGPLGKNGVVSPIGNTKIDTYLIHTKAISFTFSKGGNIFNEFILPAGSGENNTIASLQTPSDYGKFGTPGAIPVTIRTEVTSATIFRNNYSSGRNAFGTPESNELAFPVDTLTNITEIQDFNCMPIANIFYVEVLGMPGDINI